jgi:hypothetical protein
MKYFTISFHLIDNEMYPFTKKELKNCITSLFRSDVIRIAKLRIAKHSPVLIKANPKLYRLRKDEKE